MKSKTIILSLENEKGRGILTIYQEEDLLQCRIRLYNIEPLSKYCKLGIYHNNQVYSANLLKKEDVYTSSMVGDFDIDQDFYSAIIDTNNNNKVLLCGGTYAGFFFNEQPNFENKFNSFQPAKISEDLDYKPKTNNHVFDEITKEDPTTNLYSPPLNAQACDDCEKCKTCKYKEFFYSQNSIKVEETKQESPYIVGQNTPNIHHSTNQEINSKTETADHNSILKSLLPQFKYVFENYPPDETLNNLLTNAKFVKIEEEEKSYSIGAIYENDEMKYICYAVLCNYNSPAPEELGKHYQWLPLDKEDPLSEGYYIVFQDTVDLKIVELN